MGGYRVRRDVEIQEGANLDYRTTSPLDVGGFGLDLAVYRELRSTYPCCQTLAEIMSGILPVYRSRRLVENSLQRLIQKNIVCSKGKVGINKGTTSKEPTSQKKRKAYDGDGRSNKCYAFVYQLMSDCLDSFQMMDKYQPPRKAPKKPKKSKPLRYQEFSKEQLGRWMKKIEVLDSEQWVTMNQAVDLMDCRIDTGRLVFKRLHELGVLERVWMKPQDQSRFCFLWRRK